MRIRKAEAFLLEIPFKLTFRHALASRNRTTNLIVRLEDESGAQGWGEGLPREYVTGERPEQSFAFLADAILPGLRGMACGGPDDVPPLLEEWFLPGAGTQSAWCAAELAFLDLAGKVFRRSAAAWFGGAKRRDLAYGGVVPLLGEGLHPFLRRLKEAGLRHVKVKADREGFLDAVAAARDLLGEGASICVDANGSWDLAGAVKAAKLLEPLQVRWIEQPLPRGEEKALPLLAAETNIPIMADESLTTEAEARALTELAGCDLFNIRLSKLGGMAAAHRVAAVATSAGRKFQVGCQVGESAILSAAGRLLAATLPEVLALEGSYGTLLLGEDLSMEPFSFGPGGRARVQTGHGLGIDVNAERVRSLSRRERSLQ